MYVCVLRWWAGIECIVYMEICWMALRLCIIKDIPFYWGHPFRQMCVCVAIWTLHYRFNKTCLVRIGCFCFSLIGYSNSPSLSFFVFVAVMRRNPFAAEGCCRKGSRNALQELYNPTQVSICHNICELQWNMVTVFKKGYGDNEFIIIGRHFDAL